MKKLLVLVFPFAILSCDSVPNTAAREYIEQHITQGDVSFVSASEIDSTKLIKKHNLVKIRENFKKNGNMPADFVNEAPRTLYFTKIRYVVTTADGKSDTISQTVYMDKELSKVYAIKTN